MRVVRITRVVDSSRLYVSPSYPANFTKIMLPILHSKFVTFLQRSMSTSERAALLARARKGVRWLQETEERIHKYKE